MSLVVCDRGLPSALRAFDAVRRDGGEGGVGLFSRDRFVRTLSVK